MLLMIKLIWALIRLAYGLREFQSPHHTIPVRFEWRELSPKEIDQWYRPIDKCMMQANDPKVDIRDYFVNTCGGPNRELGKFCGPGRGPHGSCPMPLATRPYFRRGLKGYMDARRQPVRAFFHTLAEQRRDVVFIGDSLTGQTLDGMLCELQRTNASDISIKQIDIDEKCHRGYTISGFGDRDIKLTYFFAGKLTWMLPCATNPDKLPNGSGSWDYIKRQTRLEAQSSRNKGVFVIFNTGMWYNSPKEAFDEEASDAIRFLNDLAAAPSSASQDVPLGGSNNSNIAIKGKKKSKGSKKDAVAETARHNSVVYFESYPQHWNTSTGHYNAFFMKSHLDDRVIIVNNTEVVTAPNLLPPLPGPGHCCHPLLMRHDWRNIRLHQLVRELRANHISVLPVAEAMEDAYMMHSCTLGGTWMNDCTHYCFWPLMMQYQWEALAIVAASGCVGSKCKTLY